MKTPTKKNRETEFIRHEDDPDLKAPELDHPVAVKGLEKVVTSPDEAFLEDLDKPKKVVGVDSEDINTGKVKLDDPNLRVPADQPGPIPADVGRPASGPQFAGVAGLGHGPGTETPHVMDANPLNPAGVLTPGELAVGPMPDRMVDPRTGEWATPAMEERLKMLSEEEAFGEIASGTYGVNSAQNKSTQLLAGLRAAGWKINRP